VRVIRVPGERMGARHAGILAQHPGRHHGASWNEGSSHVPFRIEKKTLTPQAARNAGQLAARPDDPVAG
jgi:hypothetical protein